jgi:F-type H+-transporting ATPase subunit gamma
MALQAKVIKQKINAVGNIKKITKTMEMVSASKMRKSTEASLSSRAYALSALEILVNLADNRQVEHPLLTHREEGKTLVVIVASNKGLAGSYNVNVSKQISLFIKNHSDLEIECVCIGKKAEQIARRNNIPVIASFTAFKDFADIDEIRSVVKVLLEQFEKEGEYKNIMVAYTQFLKSFTYEAKIKPILPVQPDSLYMMITDEKINISKASSDSLKLYLFEPSEEIVLNQVIPQLLTAVMYQVMLDAFASEHSSRMMAMQNATENAGELQEDLKLSFNKARQAAITQEIAEISAGANAL